MFRKNRKLLYLLIVVMLLFSMFNPVFAGEGTGEVSNVVIDIDNDMVIIAIDDYGEALAEGQGNKLFDYMSTIGGDGTSNTPLVRAVQSGSKFIRIGHYGEAYAATGTVAGAIESAEALDQEVLYNYLVFRGFEGDNPILTPLYPKVTFSVEGNGSLEAKVGDDAINSGASVLEGSDIDFIATPETGYQIKGWKLNDEAVNGTETTYTVEDISSDITVCVVFEEMPPTTYTVSFDVAGSNGSLEAKVGDTVLTSGDAVEEGSNVEFTATPDEGYQVKEWTLNGSLVEGVTSNNYTVTNLDSAISVTVVFEEIPPATYTVLFDVAGSNGSLEAKVGDTVLTSGDAVEEGSNVEFTATPDEGYQVKEWTLNGSLVEGVISQTFTVDNLSSDITVNVEFQEISLVTSALVSELAREGDGIESGIRELVPGVFNVELDMDKVEYKFGDVSYHDLKLFIEDKVIKGSAAKEIIDRFIIRPNYAVLTAVQQGIQTEEVTINQTTLTQATVKLIPKGAFVSELYREGIDHIYQDGQLCYGVSSVVGGVYNVQLGMTKIEDLFGDISGYHLQLLVDGKIVKGLDEENNSVDTFIIKDGYAILAAIQQGKQSEDITINPSNLAEGFVRLIK